MERGARAGQKMEERARVHIRRIGAKIQREEGIIGRQKRTEQGERKREDWEEGKEQRRCHGRNAQRKANLLKEI